jgi:hypothetical protein
MSESKVVLGFEWLRRDFARIVARAVHLEGVSGCSQMGASVPNGSLQCPTGRMFRRWCAPLVKPVRVAPRITVEWGPIG